MLELDVTVVYRFLVALLIGALVGVEREKSQKESGHVTFAGLRTFILLAQFGAIAAWLSDHLHSSLPLAIGLAAVSTVMLVAYWRETQLRTGSLGVSTEIAAITVFLLGAIVMFGNLEMAVALGILTSAVLAFKQPLHGLVARIGTEDIYAVLKLLIATFVVLPLLPNRAVDPWQALNPYTLWLLVILISSLSLVGYIAVRLLGEARGTAITGVAGGLVSSTAVSLAFARQSRSDTSPTTADALVAGILLSWVMMFIRVLVMVAVVQRGLLPSLIDGMVVLAASAALLAGIFLWRGQRQRRLSPVTRELPMHNPFSLSAAAKFAAFFALILVVVKLAGDFASGTGIYVVAAVAGLTDVDAITLSVAQGVSDNIQMSTATLAIVIAALSNTLVKCGIVLALGRGPLRAQLAIATTALVVIGALALWLL